MQVRGFLLEHQIEEGVDLCHKGVLLDSTSDCKHTNPVAGVISDEIAASGVISFARFMELALYHPEHGYYYRSKNNTGKTGDFYTSVSVGELFGQMLAFHLRGRRQIVEAGANDGR